MHITLTQAFTQGNNKGFYLTLNMLSRLLISFALRVMVLLDFRIFLNLLHTCCYEGR